MWYSMNTTLSMYRRIPQLRPPLPFVHANVGQNRGGGLFTGEWYLHVMTITDQRMPRGHAISALSLAVWWAKLEKWVLVWWEPQWCRLEEPDPLLIKGHFMNPLIYRQLKDTFTSSNYYDSKDFNTLYCQLWLLLTLAAKRRQRVTAITWTILSVRPSIRLKLW